MVFGWNKKKTEQEEHASTATLSKEIKLGQIDEILTELKNSKQKQIVTNIKPLSANVQAELNSIFKIINQLS